MSSHPLVQFVDSLERIKRYNYRAEDLLNLVKSGLYGGFTQEDLDLFEYYVNFADIKGRHKFLSDFTANSRDKYDLDQLNALRSQLVGLWTSCLTVANKRVLVCLRNLRSF